MFFVMSQLHKNRMKKMYKRNIGSGIIVEKERDTEREREIEEEREVFKTLGAT